MARKTRDQRIERARLVAEGELAQRMKHPAVIAAVQRIQAKANELYDEYRRHDEHLDAIQEKRDRLFMSARENPPQDLRDRVKALEEEEAPILARGAYAPYQFDFEKHATPYSECDPFCKDRIICLEYGVIVSVLPDHTAEERPHLWRWVRPDATLAAVNLLIPQRLLPMPQWVSLQVDLNAARASRQAVVGDFEALLDHFHAMPPHPLDPTPIATRRRRSSYKVSETVKMLTAYERGETHAKIGLKHKLHRTSVADRIRWLCDTMGVPVPHRGEPLIAAPPHSRCEPNGKLPGCPDRLCADCPILKGHPDLRKMVENERRWDQERIRSRND